MMKLTLKAKIRLSFIILGLLIVVISLIAVFNSHATSKVVSKLSFKDSPSVVENAKMNGIAKDMRAVIFRLNFSNIKLENVDKVEARFQELHDTYVASKNEYLSLPFDGDNEKLLYEKTNKLFEQWVLISKKLIELKKKNAEEQFQEVLSSEYREGANNYLLSATEFIDFLSVKTKQRNEEIVELNQRNTTILYALLMLGIISSILLTVLVSKATATSLNELHSTFIKRYKVVFDICLSSEKISRENLARVDQQSSALYETSAATEENLRTVEEVSKQSVRLQTLSSNNKQELISGKEQLATLTSEMRNLNKLNQEIVLQFENMNRNIGEVFTIFSNVESKTQMINDIVFQTKLLSFNASVESARAGEHGKGFSVVANEINELAKKSGISADEITKIIQDSKKKIESLINNSENASKVIINNFKNVIDKCMDFSQLTSEKIETSVTSFADVVNTIDGISKATAQQVSALSQINVALNELQNVNKENENGAHEASSLLIKLKDEAMKMEEDVSIVVFGDKK